MNEQIRGLLAHHPNGLHLREIAMYLRINRFKVSDILDEMKKEGIIDGRSNEDHANGEYFIIWYLVK
jgi:DNA-binding transcriptional regulator LsrR (DeoR family)